MAVEAVGTVQTVQPKKTGGSRKALASAFVPGLGQFLDGRNAMGTVCMIDGGLIGIAGYTIHKIIAERVKAASKAATTTGASFDVLKYLKSSWKSLARDDKMFAGTIMVTLLGGWLLNILDAYKGGKQA